ncbi:XRE family transcriptional regulator [Spiroplasma endosymbiont of Amphibalanus improvisus]|uniref:helix-turn-helix domain-containing protein n=1 Tax=Spiroplasma endosymbiont of Amphibalanus improvisus TaxID=3066327 RepID=UPI00313B5BC4
MDIGPKIRILRQKSGLTLQELAERSDLSKGFISQVERNLSSPSVETLSNILRVLGTNMSDFFKGTKNDRFVFTEKQIYVESCQSYEIRYLSPSTPTNKLEPLELILNKNTKSKIIKPFHGEIFGYIIEGEVSIIYGEHKKIAMAGNSFYLYGNKSHQIENNTNDKARIIWVSTPPIF